jgi:DNA phosphorothioation-dependent restriction protein DptH
MQQQEKLLLDERIGRFVANRLKEQLINKEPGHCAQVADLSLEVMVKACKELNDIGAGKIESYVLAANDAEFMEHWEIQATKLVERRNVEEKIVVIFIPHNLKTAAEDSFEINTFEPISFYSVYDDVKESLQHEVIQQFLGHDRSAFEHTIITIERNWKIPTSLDWSLYYLAIMSEKYTSESVGKNLPYLFLLPDQQLLSQGALKARVEENIRTIDGLRSVSKSIQNRVDSINTKNKNVKRTVLKLLRKYTISLNFDQWIKETLTDATLMDKLDFEQWNLEVLTDKLVTFEIDQIKGPALKSKDSVVELTISSGNHFSIHYTVEPTPPRCEDWARMQVHLIDAAAEEEYTNVHTITSSKKPNTNKSKQTKKITDKQLQKLSTVEPGTYKIGIRALSEDNYILAESVSSKSFVLINDNEEDDIPKQVNTVLSGGQELLLDGKANSLLQDEPFIYNGQDFEFSFETTEEEQNLQAPMKVYNEKENAVYKLSTNLFLHKAHETWLKNPEYIGAIELQAMSRLTGKNFHEHLIFQDQTALSSEATGCLKDFLRLRKQFFQAILDVGPFHWDQIVSFDEELLLEKAWRYVEIYQKVIENLLASDSEEMQELLSRLRMIDLIGVTDLNGETIYLMTPTHPLKLTWLISYEEIGNDWIRQLALADDKTKEVKKVKEILKDQTSIYFPFIIKDKNNSWFVNSDNIGTSWSIFIPLEKMTEESYSQRISSILKLNHDFKRKVKFPIPKIKQHILKYLEKRPYLSVLTINVFEPGEGTELVDLLKQLYKALDEDKYQIFSDLRIKLHLFTDDKKDLDQIAKEMDLLMASGESKKVDSLQERLTMEADNPLFPIISYSKHLKQDFLQSPESFESNITILYQMLTVDSGFVTSEEAKWHRSSFFKGLNHELTTRTGGRSDRDHGSSWKKFISTKFDVKDARSKQINQMIDTFKGLTMFDEADHQSDLPAVEVSINPDKKLELETIHNHSDWVLLLDEYLGVDFLDRPASGRDRYHLIDYVPSKVLEKSDVYVSTNQIVEIENMVRQVANKLALQLEEGAERGIIDSLNAISGRLVMKLSSNENQVKGAMGMALSRLYLNELNRVDGKMKVIIFSLDEHKDWFLKERQHLTSQKMTDILMIACNVETREITFNLIEVKWRSSLPSGGIASAEDFRELIDAQLENSKKLLMQKFQQHDQTEASNLYRAKELSKLLEYYLDRSYRFKSMDEESYVTFSRFFNELSDLDKPYSLAFKKHALLFVVGEQNLSEPIRIGGVSYHVISKPEMEGYLNQANDQFSEPTQIFSHDQLKHRTTFFFSKSMASSAPVENEKPDVEEEEIDLGQEPEMDQRGTEPNQADVQGDTPIEEDAPIELDLGQGQEEEEQDNSEVNQDHNGDEPNSEEEGAIEEKYQEEEVTEDLGEEELDQQDESAREVIPCNPPTVLLGDHQMTNQYGILGKLATTGDTIGLDLDGTSTISLFGVQGSGKSYTVGTILEMATKQFNRANKLPAPLASVVFHYSKSESYEPEFTSLKEGNQKQDELERLKAEYGVFPEGIEDVIIITPKDRVEERQEEYENIEVLPLQFSTSELNVEDWNFLMSTGDSSALYLRQLKSVLKEYRRNLTLENIKIGVQEEDFEDRPRRLLEQRLRFVEEYINDKTKIGSALKPGRVVIVDIRDEFIEEDEALGLFMVLLRIFSDVKFNNNAFNKMIVFDEAHKYMKDQSLMGNVVEVIREMRHKGVSMLIASQNPPSVPKEIIELSNLVVLHKFNAPAWLKHIQKTLTATENLQAAQLNQLKAGEAYVWASKSTHSIFEKQPQKIQLRPRITMHGGATKKATM